MNLPPFPDDDIPASPEARRRLIAWGEECARMGAEAEREQCAAICDRQRTIYATKGEQAMKAGAGERWDRFMNYEEVADWLADAIRARTDEGRG